jgi:nucleoside-diphosphate-sugar epimerase
MALLSACPPARLAPPHRQLRAPLARAPAAPRRPPRHAAPPPTRAMHANSAAAVAAGHGVLALPGSTVLVAGASGGVGQLVVASLLSRGYTVRALVRSVERGRAVFAGTDAAQGSGALSITAVDLRDGDALRASGACAGVDAVVCATGTTAFPSKRWDGGNGPEATDSVAVRNLLGAVSEASPELARFVLVSSVGVNRTRSFPYIILNAFKVLTFKGVAEVRDRACVWLGRSRRGAGGAGRRRAREGGVARDAPKSAHLTDAQSPFCEPPRLFAECACCIRALSRALQAALRDSGLPYTILRPGRLTDGPYTSYDLNTLLRATSGEKRDVQLATGDTLSPQASSRLVVAEAALQALCCAGAARRDFDVGSTVGAGPGADPEKWESLFANARPAR